MRAEKDQSNHYTVSKEDECNSESEKEDMDESYEPRRCSRIKFKDDTDERVMRTLRKLIVSYTPIMIVGWHLQMIWPW